GPDHQRHRATRHPPRAGRGRPGRTRRMGPDASPATAGTRENVGETGANHMSRSTEECRACFDFEVDFSNGGGIQGQGFRLDIDGDDIDDAALADYIVRDMRLLMVGAVRILNKQIISERHKRASAAAASTSVANACHIDLSHSIEDGMI